MLIRRLRSSMGLIALSLISLTFVSSPSSILSAYQHHSIDDAVRAEMEKQKVTGIALAIVREGKIDYLKGYGYADRKNRIAVDPKATMFRWASISKPVTAIAALQLLEQGKLDIEKQVQTYVPEFPEKPSPITLRQLLCHQGGIVHYTNGKVIVTKGDYAQEHPYEDVVHALDMFKESPLVNEPGQKYSYSTHGYMLVSAAVQKAGGEPFWNQVQERIAKPLGMKTFQPDYQWVDIPNRAVGYRKRSGKVVPSTDTDVSWKLGGGGFISTVEDLARFAIGIMDRKLVSEETEKLMWTSQKTTDGMPTGYGLGFQVRRLPNGSLQVSHNGGQEKTSTRMVIVPKDRFAVVLMSNSEYAQVNRFTEIIESALGR